MDFDGVGEGLGDVGGLDTVADVGSDSWFDFGDFDAGGFDI